MATIRDTRQDAMPRAPDTKESETGYPKGKHPLPLKGREKAPPPPESGKG